MSWVTYYIKLVDTKQLNCASCKCTTSVFIFHELLVIGATKFGGEAEESSLLFVFFFNTHFSWFFPFSSGHPSPDFFSENSPILGLYPYSFPFPTNIFAGEYYPILFTTCQIQHTHLFWQDFSLAFACLHP